jgi:putative sterol carrier protein
VTPDIPSSDAFPSSPELFGPEWAERLERELAVSERYRAAAASWKGSLAFELQPDGTPGFPVGRGLFLDLAHGNCRAARPAMAGDLESATFCLSGPASTWLRLLGGTLEPGAALMGGGLKLSRGSFFSLLPHLKAAQALLECARLVPTHIPSPGV